MNVVKEMLGNEWYNILKDEFNKDYMTNLIEFIKLRRAENVVYPPKGEIFNAYKYTPYDEVRVCIIGQDPYQNEGLAHGLAFSTYNGKYTPSLRQIEKAIRKDVYPSIDYIWSNNLKCWAKQGIMLLNTVLTVDEGNSNSHKDKGWEKFTLKTVLELDKNGIIFLLWGKDAQAFIPYIKNSTVIICEHPVASSYKGREWENNDCFNKVNKLIKGDKIIW